MTLALKYRICVEYNVQFCSRCHTKRRIGGAPPANLSFGMTPTTELYIVFFTDSIFKASVIPKGGLAGLHLPILLLV